MTGIAEISLAVAFAGELEQTGACAHAGYRFQPMSLAKHEADEIAKFDPSYLQILKDNGVTVETATLADYELIGSNVEDSIRFPSYNTIEGSRKLQKHAIAHRLGKTMVLLGTSPDFAAIRTLARVFRHPHSSY